jgi:hypothetical protein
LHIQINHPVNFYKLVAQNFDWDDVESIGQFGKKDSLTVLNLSITEYVVALHLFRFSQIFLSTVIIYYRGLTHILLDLFLKVYVL